ncbi:type I 3-dehydroquinate dehydratase [Salinadaptatus halalkaliphilus]|uniref:3-dehydroquinate dehydratase n=1 Tax=Salinadaptatus halalkaliphilus TaxID=2419781 RepID=A0A4S3THW0_9EURY|nr:type I 3-dehydroquinate dehydratase [Salinadaptatus halalkaliphilus]THE63521.1 type I 3-dehydroquinate dehydratase [Salinadaptatus halalkaliphilus]
MTLDFEPFTLAAAIADLSEEPNARPSADAIEFRMDLADSPLEALAEYDGDLPLIVTNRAEWEGGEAPDENRIETLTTAVDSPNVEAVDIELASLEDGDGTELLEAASQQDVSVIVSTHNFEETPPADELSRLLRDAGEYGDVAKLAVTADDYDDTLALLEVTYKHSSRGETVATMSMGAVGGHTRAVAFAYGSAIGYAPVDPTKATAPGQYDIETLRRLADDLV